MTFRAALLDDYQDAAAGLADWAKLGPGVELVFFHDHVDDADELVTRLKPFDAVIAIRERTAFPREVMSRLPRLRLIVSLSMANAVIDVGAAQELNIMVVGTSAPFGVPATIELTWALILSVCRGVPREDAAIRSGSWQVGLGTILAGKTLGIVGLGNFGSRMVPIGRAFGMEVVAWSQNLTRERAEEVGVLALDRATFFETSDVVTVHIKLSDRSRGYVRREDLRRMKSTAFIVNTSRGTVVDEAALIEALEAGWIAGAGLDVFAAEPLPPDHPLRGLPNTVVTPHIGYVSVESYRAHFADVVDDIEQYLRGTPIRVLTDAGHQPA
jgi:phosphoglycerate dehydrogenase-like enzyme